MNTRTTVEELIIAALLIAVAVVAFVVAQTFARETVCRVVLSAGVSFDESGKSITEPSVILSTGGHVK